MSLLDVVFEPVIETQIVTVKQIFKDDTTFDGLTNSFSQYPKINLITYDNPTDPYEFTTKKYVDDVFLTQSNATSTYLSQADATSTYLTQADATSTYLPTATASSTYLSQADATSTYLTQASASSTYLPSATASSTYLSQASASSTYLTQASASSTYLPTATASTTYLSQADATTALALKATESFVTTSITTAINNLINSAPGTMDTLGEIATILQTNVNDISTITTSIAGKVSKTANETVSGILTFSQPPVMSGASIASGTIPDVSLSSTFLKTADASSIYLSQTDATTALNLKANLANPTFSGTVGGITKSMVGLTNVDNVADTNKPVSTAQQTAINNNIPTVINNSTTGLIAGSSITALEREYLITNMGTNITVTVNSVANSIPMGGSIRVTSLTSPTVSLDGIASNWTPRNNSFALNTINGVAYGNVGGTSYYVVVGNAGMLATSTDGITWTSRTSGFGSTAINNIAYGTIGGTGYFVCVGASGVLTTSTDAINWTSRTSGFGTTAINSVGYGNDTFIVVGASGVLTTSTDAINWTSRTSGFGSNAINAIAYGTVGATNYFVAVGASGTMTTATTADLTTWTARTSGFGTGTIFGIVFGNGTFVATGAGGLGSGGLISTSTDAINWTNRVHPWGSNGNWVSYGVIGSTNVFIISSANSTIISYSNDGIIWSRRTTPIAPQTLSTTKIGYGNGMFLLVGANGLILTSSNQVSCVITPVTYQAL